MKDRAIGLGLVLAVALAIAGVSYLAHRIGDPTWAGPVVTGLMSVFGLTILWLKTPPKAGPPAIPPTSGGAS